MPFVTLRPLRPRRDNGGGLTMSISAWEQDALDSIKTGLADSDPALVAQLTMFARLASGEDMPVREKLQAVKRQVARRRRRMYQRLGLSRAMVLVWLVTTLTLIAAALASSRGDGPAAAPDPSSRCAAAPARRLSRPSPSPDGNHGHTAFSDPRVRPSRAASTQNIITYFMSPPGSPRGRARTCMRSPCGPNRISSSAGSPPRRCRTSAGRGCRTRGPDRGPCLIATSARRFVKSPPAERWSGHERDL